MRRSLPTQMDRLAFIRTLVDLHRGPVGLGNRCVTWPYAKVGIGQHGHAVVYHDGKVHRVAHLVLTALGQPRPEPPRHKVLHSCGSSWCVHPDHMRWATQHDIMQARVDRINGLVPNP